MFILLSISFLKILLTLPLLEFPAPISAADDPVLHTVQTVGRLSNKVSRRVYRSVSRQIKQLKKEDVHEYVASLIAVLRLTQYLNFINEKVQSVNQSNENVNESVSNENKTEQVPAPVENNAVEKIEEKKDIPFSDY